MYSITVIGSLMPSLSWASIRLIHFSANSLSLDKSGMKLPANAAILPRATEPTMRSMGISSVATANWPVTDLLLSISSSTCM